MDIASLQEKKEATAITEGKGDGQEQVFTMATPKGVYALLKSKHYLSSRRFSGDFTASDILLDLFQAIEYAKLTPRQEQTIFLLFELDLTQQETAERMGIKQHTVSSNLKGALKKIAQVYLEWGE